MNHLPPNISPSDPETRRRLWLRYLKRIGIPVGLVTLAGSAGAIAWGWHFVINDLSPLVAKNLTQALNRPVELGKVEQFNLTSLQFGQSSLPPTATDPDQLSIPAVRVQFNLFQLVVNHTLNLDITAIQPRIYLEQSQTNAWVTTRFTEQKDTGPLKLKIHTIRVEDAKAILVPWKVGVGRRQPITLISLQGKVNLLDQNRRFVYDLTGKFITGGNFNLKGTTRQDTQTTHLQAEGQNFLVSEIDRLVNVPALELQAGRVDGRVNLQVRNGNTTKLDGNAQFTGVTLKAEGVPQPLTQGQGKLFFKDTEIRLLNTIGRYGLVPAVVNGTINTQKGLNLGIQIKSATLLDVVKSLQVPVPVKIAGAIQANLQLTGSIAAPVLEGMTQNTQSGIIDRIAIEHYGARFRLDTKKRLLTLTEIKIVPATGGMVTGNGRVNLAHSGKIALNFNVHQIATDAIVHSYNNGNSLAFNIGAMNAQTQITGTANHLTMLTRWQALDGTYPARGEIVLANGVMALKNTVLDVADGVARVEGQATNGRWQGTVTGSGIQLSRISPDLRGQFDGRLAATGSLASLNLSNLRAQGQMRLSQGIAVIAEPLTAQIRWDGQKLVVDQASAPGLSVSGNIYARLQGTPAIASLDLNVRASNYNLRSLNISLPERVDYSGNANFVGQVQGTPASLNVAGNVALQHFEVNGITFEPQLKGTLQLDRGIHFEVAGAQDRIAALLNSNYRPIAFDVQRGNAAIVGQTQGDRLRVSVQNVSMALLNGFLPTSQFPLGGTLNGILVRNWDTDSVIGQVAISNPSFGIYQANQFNGQISYTNGIAILTTGVLRRGRTLFQLNGQADLQGSDPQFKGQLAVAQGKLQDLVELAQISDLTDFTQGGSKPSGGRASHLQTVPIDMSQQPVINQLRRLAELQALLAQTEQQKPLLPSLSDLQGRFDGQVSIAGSLKHGISASFNLRGENWVWGPYSAEHIVALGTFENGVLSLRPLRFQSDQSVIAFAGQIGGSQQAGQFRMANVPLSSLSHLMPSMSLDGSLNATATLSGQLLNPQVIGSISLTNASLNGKPIRDAQGNFQYNHARLNFDSQIIAAEPEPILITGTVPLRLPFASISPASDAISLKVNVKNDGLAILNLLNNQVEWVNGKGEVALEVGGTLANPVTTGLIQVQNATLRARALPDPITNVNGRMTLNGDMIAVERLTGQFSQGEIVASGFLPLTKAVPANYPNTADALRIDLNKITLNLKGLYQGVVDGRLVVNGTVFRPQLGGQIALNNGNVLLAGTSSETGSGRTREASSVEFNHLQLTLGNRLRISNYPLLNFVATGHLIINGNLSNPRPQGIIDLKSGQVNLFTTRFNLERGYPQTAEFVENQGLDPILNMRLVALVFDVTGNQLPLSVNSSEILPPNFTGFSSAQSVRIQARVAGPASQLDQNLQLTSSPTRTRTEIVALIGGGFLANLQQGQVGVGLENLVSSVVASDVQSWLANTLGFHDIYFDLFPIITSNQDSRLLGWSSNLNLALEVGVGLTRSLSVNGLKVLTSDQPVQFGLRYRVNDNLFLRGSTDFSGDNRAVLQYEQRF